MKIFLKKYSTRPRKCAAAFGGQKRTYHHSPFGNSLQANMDNGSLSGLWTAPFAITLLRFKNSRIIISYSLEKSQTDYRRLDCRNDPVLFSPFPYPSLVGPKIEKNKTRKCSNRRSFRYRCLTAYIYSVNTAVFIRFYDVGVLLRR